MKDVNLISKRIEKKKRDFAELYAKDVENYDLWEGKEQTFDTHEMSVNITGTELVSLATKIQAALVRSRLQIIVLPPDKYPNPNASEVANQEERMYYYGFDKANENLDNIGEAELLQSMAWQATVLGRIAVRVFVYVDEDTGEIVWSYLPLNPRLLTFSFGSKGLVWANYETFRSADGIKEEYNVDVDDPDGRGVAVCDYWDKENNVRFLSKDKQILGKVWKNAFEEVPVIIEPISMGALAIDETGLKVANLGQSIFDNVKTSFRQLNRMTSVAATHAFKLAYNPAIYKFPEGSQPAIEEETIRATALLKMPNTHSLEGLRIPDIPQSLGGIIQTLREGIERATYHELNPDRPAHSGSGLRILGQDKADVLTPRMRALGNVYRRICRMVKRQVIAQALTVEVNTVVNASYQVYDLAPELLDNDFYVNAELVRQDAYDEVEALQRAQMMMNLRLQSREDVVEKIMKEPDTQTQIAKMDMEDVEAMIPELKVKRVIAVYQERGMAEEAGMAKEHLAIMLMQKQQALGQMMMQGEGAPPESTGGVPPENKEMI